MELYSGYDTFSGKEKSQIVQPNGEPPQASSSSTAKIFVAKSMEELQDSLEIDASVKVSYGAFSVDDKAKYLNSLDLTTNSISIVIYSSKKYTTERNNVSIAEEVKEKLVTDDGISEFVRTYGDAWVSKIVKGGEFCATFTFYCQTKQEKQDIENTLSASGVVGGVSIDASLSVKLSHCLKTSKTEYKYDNYLTGFSTSATPQMTTDTDAFTAALINFALSLQDKTPDNPATLSYEVSAYEDEVLDGDIDFDKVTTNRTGFLGDLANPGWGQMLAQLVVVMNSCIDFEKTYQYYGQYSDTELKNKLAQIKKDISALQTFIHKVGRNPNDTYEFTAPESFGYGFQALNYSATVPNSTFLNGGGGGHYDDVSLADVPSGIRLYSIQLYNDGLTNGFVSRYATRYPNFTPSTNRNSGIPGDAGISHGSLGPGTPGEWIFGPDEYIVSIYGYMGDWVGHSTVAGLYIKTNKGNEYFNQLDIPTRSDVQKWDAQQGDYLIGFSGSSGDKIDCIRPFVLRFSPATWVQFES